MLLFKVSPKSFRSFVKLLLERFILMKIDFHTRLAGVPLSRPSEGHSLRPPAETKPRSDPRETLESGMDEETVMAPKPRCQ